jgi:hypothetical protein
MAKISFAVIENELVKNIIVAESKEIAEEVTGKICVQIEWVPGAPGIGWTYKDGTFTAPIVETPKNADTSKPA